VIDDCLKLIEKNRGEKVDIEAIPLDDAETYKKVFHSALTSECFSSSQAECGMCSGVQAGFGGGPDGAECAVPAGPIQGGMIDDFIERKLGRRKVEYALPELEGILKETLGVIVYQEQVMQISNLLASYSTGRGGLTAAFNGQEERRGHGRAARPLYGRRSGSGPSKGDSGRHLRHDGEVCRVWVQ